MTKKELNNKNEMYWQNDTFWLESKFFKRNQAKMKEEINKQPKVIMLLVDALREDFVEFDPYQSSNKINQESIKAIHKNKNFLDTSKSVYQGKKLKLLNKLAIEQPKNAILMPMEAELPTVTTVRIKAIMTGALSSFFESKDEYAGDKIPEDNVLHQAKTFKQYVNNGKRVVFTGDHIWMGLFGAYMDKERHYSSHNIRDLDTVDQSVSLDFDEIFAKQDSDPDFKYDLLVAHILGIDHAGHSFHANHTEIERKVVETEEILEKVISQLDNDTVLILYGDHGMTNDGNHGGGSQ